MTRLALPSTGAGLAAIGFRAAAESAGTVAPIASFPRNPDIVIIPSPALHRRRKCRRVIISATRSRSVMTSPQWRGRKDSPQRRGGRREEKYVLSHRWGTDGHR